MRDFGVTARLVEAAGPLVVLFALLTQLGDLWFLALITLVPYWYGSALPRLGAAVDRERAAILVALLFGAVALLTTLKPIFGLPRPPGAGVPPRADLIPAALEGLYAWLSTGDGFGFPSGHATGATLVFGGLAWALQVGSRRRRAAAAAGLVALVSLSRLVLGVHYLPDVLAGMAVGVTYLGVVLALGTPRRAFGLAAAVTLLGLPLVGAHTELLGALGVCVGGFAAWSVWGDRLLGDPTRAAGTATTLLGLATAGPLLAAVGEGLLGPWASLAVGAVGGTLVVALPLVGQRVAKK